MVFLQDSLFSQAKEDEIDGLRQPTQLPEKGSQFIEADVVKNFSACFLDYFYTMELPKDGSAESMEEESRQAGKKEIDLIKEMSAKRLIIGHVQTFVTSQLIHMVTKLAEFSVVDSPPRKGMQYFQKFF